MCTRPMIAFPVGLNPSGKPKYMMYKVSNFESKGIDPREKVGAEINGKFYPRIEIPCGKCMECKLAYAKQWSDRCMLELQDHQSNYFINLTYNSEAIEKYNKVEKDNKVAYTLIKSDFQNFIKRLRKKLDDPVVAKQLGYTVDDLDPETGKLKIKYYMCGEYGTENWRPHYHAIIYNLRLNDLVFYKRSDSGENLYTSEFLSSFWYKSEDDPISLGFVVVGSVSPESCSYVARYVQKKAGHLISDVYKKMDILPEYTNMSTRPAIGLSYFEKNVDKIKNSRYTYVSTEKGGYRVYWPRYFRKKLADLDPEYVENLRNENIQRNFDKLQEKLSHSTMSYIEDCAAREANLLARTKSLRRDL